MKSILAVLLTAASSWSADLVFPPPPLEREGPVQVAFRSANRLGKGNATLVIRWTDSYGRLVEDRSLPVTLNNAREIPFSIDLRRAVAMHNTLEARLDLGRGEKRNAGGGETAKATFVAAPSGRWSDYDIIMWQPQTAAGAASLKPLGINGGMWNPRERYAPGSLLNNDMRWYVENIATDFYSEYHRYFNNQRKNWKFIAAREEYKKDPTSREPFKRQPSLSDPVWLDKVRDRLVAVTKVFQPYRPFFYSLGDETGIADLAAFWDFDFSPESLAGMRRWLRERYRSLDALNKQWETEFADWDAVMPPTTDEAMKAPGENFSAWSDFKEWMDVSYAAALKMGADAVRSVDPNAYVGIGGAQMPGWGGYDYSRIVDAINYIEPYDIGNNIEIIRSLNPRMAVVTTSFATGDWEKHRVWYELLHGNRGLIIWDDKAGFLGPGNTIADRGREAAKYYNEIRGGVGALLIASERLSDPIAIHYSQPSLRIEWMLAQRPRGGEWLTRNSSTEYTDSRFLRLRESWCRLIEDHGLQYNFVSYGQVERGELLRGGYKALVLPQSSALSAAEVKEITAFVAQGGTVIADGEPGRYDEHCRRLPKPGLTDLFDAAGAGTGKAIRMTPGILNYHQDRLVGKEGGMHSRAGEMFSAAGLKPRFAVTDAHGNRPVGVETHTFRNGNVWIVALLPNPQLRVDELGPPEFKSNERFAKPVPVRLTLPGDAFVYDVRAAKPLGKVSSLPATVDAFEPLIFSVAESEIAAPSVSLPARIARGESARVAIAVASSRPAATHVLHVEVSNPSGQIVGHYSGNLSAPDGRAAKLIPIALNDPAGRWEIRVKDILTGQSSVSAFEVF
jgi:hypothetical protein